MNEFKSVAVEGAKEISNRIKNPLLFSYLLSWVVCNWKPLLLIVFSSESLEGKIFLIKNINNVDKHNLYSFNWWTPILVAIVYVLLLPLIMGFVEWIMLKIHVWRGCMQSDRDYGIKKKQKKNETELANMTLALTKTEVETNKLKTEFVEITTTKGKKMKLLASVVKLYDVEYNRIKIPLNNSFYNYVTDVLFTTVQNKSIVRNSNYDLELINLDIITDGIRPQLTNKGEYFWYKYSNEQK